LCLRGGPGKALGEDRRPKKRKLYLAGDPPGACGAD